MATATEQALQPETFADMPTDPVPTDPGWFSQLLKGTLGALYSPKFYSGEPWVDESAYILPTSSQVGEGIFSQESADTAKNRAMMMGLNTENYDQHMRYAGALEDKVNTGEMTLGEYHVESAKNLAQIQKDQGGLQATINALTGGALMGAQGALWQYKTEAQKSDQPDYVGDWGDVASRDLAGNIQGISEVYGQPYRDIVDRTKAWFQPSTESGMIDTSVPLTDEINFSGPVQDAARALYDAQQTPVSQALQGIPINPVQTPDYPIGDPRWKPNLGGGGTLVPPGTSITDPALEQAITHQYNPAEFGLDPFTREQVGTSSNFLANLMAEGTEAQKTAIQRAISPGTSGILRENLAAHFARDDAESPFMVDPSTGETYEFASRAPVDMANILRSAEVEPTISREQEIENMMREDREEQLKFHPSSPLYEAPFEEGTGPEEEVSEERVVAIKKKPKEKRTSVEEQVVVASAVKKALSNASKGKKVKKELKAIVELAKVDPTIVKRYTTPGSQELQDITAQVDSFSFMPTIQKKKKTVDPWAFEDRRGGRR